MTVDVTKMADPEADYMAEDLGKMLGVEFSIRRVPVRGGTPRLNLRVASGGVIYPLCEVSNSECKRTLRTMLDLVKMGVVPRRAAS